jgi:hypothetical protein
MLRSSSLFLLLATASLAAATNNTATPPGYEALLERANQVEEHCLLTGVEIAIQTQIHNTVSAKTNGEYSGLLTRELGPPVRKLRTGVSPRELALADVHCEEDCRCATSMMCRITSYSCYDTCGGGTTCLCDDGARFLWDSVVVEKAEFGRDVSARVLPGEACLPWVQPNGATLTKIDRDNILSCEVTKDLKILATSLNAQGNQCLGTPEELVAFVYTFN